jgi:hypothetical protein
MKQLILFFTKHTRKGSRSRKILEWVCVHTGGHVASNDIGYGGGPMIDVWCRYCDALYQIPKLEKDIPEIFKDFMTAFDEEMRGERAYFQEFINWLKLNDQEKI